MSESLFASQAKIGEKYLTSTGHPIEVVAPTLKGELLVRSLLRGTTHIVPYSQIFRPYRSQLINQEAIQMAKAEKRAGGNKSKGTGVKVEVKRIEKTASGAKLFRSYKGVDHEVTFFNGKLEYKEKGYTTLAEVVSKIKGKEISGKGLSFFGLRREPNITLGKEILKAQEVSDEAEKVAKKAKKAPKTRRVKIDQDDEDDGVESNKAGVTASSGVVARGRGR